MIASVREETRAWITNTPVVHESAAPQQRNDAGQRLWARGFFVDTVGRNTEAVRRYIREQEAEDIRLDQREMALPDGTPRNETK